MDSFTAAIEALKAKGVRTSADVVVNHMANERNAATAFPGDASLREYETDKSYWGRQIVHGDADGNGVLDNGVLPDDDKPDGLFSLQNFHPAACIRDSRNRVSVIADRICGSDPDSGLPDLKDTDPT